MSSNDVCTCWHTIFKALGWKNNLFNWSIVWIKIEVLWWGLNSIGKSLNYSLIKTSMSCYLEIKSTLYLKSDFQTQVKKCKYFSPDSVHYIQHYFLVTDLLLKMHLGLCTYCQWMSQPFHQCQVRQWHQSLVCNSTSIGKSHMISSLSYPQVIYPLLCVGGDCLIDSFHSKE
jgi:hypothetical protein